MSDVDAFRDLLRRVRAGDEGAAAELVRQYEPAIRLAVHVRLTDPGLRRLFDSQDVCQSVLTSFLVRASAGQYDLDTPEQLLRLLATMARNKLLNRAGKERAARRDYRRQQHDVAEHEVADPGPGPSEVVERQELLHEFRRRLSDEERRLADDRSRGRSWQEIADAVGGTANAARMRLERAVDRVAKELGLEP